ncbi:MAG: NAD-dependent epimerase/dehydratase family protein [Gemmatimonadota bacterium]
MDRRDFLNSLLAGGMLFPAAAFGATSNGISYGLVRPGARDAARSRRRNLRILMLGGTNYVGPHLVQTALDRGHDVTLFNRGITNPHLFPELEKLRGDRYPDRGEGLAALETERTWDAVIDTWQAAPGCIDHTTRLLADRTDRYLYISSIATYRHYRDLGITEDGPLLDAAEHIGSFADDLGYATRKRAGEETVERRFGERGTVLRCTSIQGFGGFGLEPVTQTGYWDYRFLIGEPLLAPDDPTAAFQLIDVKDVAAFAIRAIEHGYGGAFNMVGPEEPLTLPEYLSAWSEATDHRSPIVWIDPDWLREQGVEPWNDIRNWIPGDDPEPGFYRISNRKSLAHGLTYRPLDATLRDVLRVERAEPSELELPTVGMSRERELELIEAWRAAAASAGRRLERARAR